MDTTFKRMDKELEDMNLEEARSYVIDSLNTVEEMMSSLIIEHFQPANRRDFQMIILNNSIVSFAGKVKILTSINFGKVSNKLNLYQKLMDLSSIRNAFAHNRIIQIPTISVNENQGQKQVVVSKISDIMDVMDSHGKVSQKDAREQLQKFHKLYVEVCNGFRDFSNHSSA